MLMSLEKVSKFLRHLGPHYFLDVAAKVKTGYVMVRPLSDISENPVRSRKFQGLQTR